MQPSPPDMPCETQPSSPGAARSTRRGYWAAVIGGGAVCAGALLFIVGNWFVMPLVTYGRTVRVPDLYELDVAVAKRRLLDSGLVFVNDSTDYLWDYDVPANHVVAQTPAPYSAVKRGRGVRVTISRGPQLYPVPDVRNISTTEAKLRLQQQFFEVGTVSYLLRTNDDRSEPFVMDQTPASGAMLSRGAKVSLSVSILPEMPDLTGRGFDEAKRFVEVLGLRVGSVQLEQNDDLLPRSVVGQSIPPGARIRAGDTVDLVLSHL